MHALLERQPANVRRLAEEIESAIGAEILIELGDTPDDLAACAIPAFDGKFTATIRVAAPESRQPLTTEIVCHELLHLHRYFCEGVPMFYWRTPPTFTGHAGGPIEAAGLADGGTCPYVLSAANIENQLEHLVIIPRMRERYGLDMEVRPWLDWIIAEHTRMVAESAAPGLLSFKRWLILLDALAAYHLAPECWEAAGELLTAADLWDVGLQMCELAGMVRHKKIPLLGVVLGALGVPLQAAGLVRFDVAAGDCPTMPYPELQRVNPPVRFGKPPVRAALGVPAGWDANPHVGVAASGDQFWEVDVGWQWPLSDQNISTLGGLNFVLDDGITQKYLGNIGYSTGVTSWVLPHQAVRPGTVAYTLWLISYSVDAQNNKLLAGVTPSVQFTVTRKVGAAGIENCALVLSDGVNAFVTATAVAGNDGSSLLKIDGYWAAPNDPSFGGAEIVAIAPSDVGRTIAAGRLSPITNYITNPATSQAWDFYLRSVDVNGLRNTIVPGVTPKVTITVGGGSQLDLSKVKTGTFASGQFTVVSGAFTVTALSATIVNTGILQVGGGGGKVSQLKVFDTLGSLIGWVGDDTGVSGFVGGWFKTLRVGGSSPANAPLKADSVGNLLLGGSGIATPYMRVLDSSGVEIGRIGSQVGTSKDGAWFQQAYIGGTSASNAPIVANSSGTVTINGASFTLNLNGITTTIGNTGIGGVFYGVTVKENASGTKMFRMNQYALEGVNSSSLFVVEARADNSDCGLVKVSHSDGAQRIALDGNDGYVYSWSGLKVRNPSTTNYDVLIASQKGGWHLPTGTLSRATFDPSTVTLGDLAKIVAAVVTDFYSWHGLFGA